MSTEANRAILVAIHDGLSRSDSRAFLEAMTDDFTWIMIGDTDWSGVYRGKTVVREELLRPLMTRFKSYRNAPERIIVDGDWAAVQCRGEAETHDGKRYDNSYCWIYRFQEGRVVELTEYMDTELVRSALGPFTRAKSQ